MSSFVPAKLIVPSALRGIGLAANAPGSADGCARAGDNDSATAMAATAQRVGADPVAIDASVLALGRRTGARALGRALGDRLALARRRAEDLARGPELHGARVRAQAAVAC